MSEEWDRPRNPLVYYALMTSFAGLVIFFIDQLVLGHSTEAMGDPSPVGELGGLLACIGMALALTLWLIGGLAAEMRRFRSRRTR